MAKRLPKQIQQQVDEVNAWYQQQDKAAEDKTAEAEENKAGEAAQTEAPATAPADATAPPEGTTSEAPAQPEAKPAGPKEEVSVWEQRYKTLQGMHNQNVADLKQRLEAAQAESREMAERLSQIEAATRQAKQTVDPKFVEEFGEDLVGMVQAIVKSNLEQAGTQFDTQIKDLDGKVSSTEQQLVQTANDLFLERLAKQVPNLARVNEDPDFLAWLAEVDPIYGEPRQTALDKAAQAHDVTRTANIFNAFLRTQQPAEPAPAAPQRKPNNPQLEKQVAPDAGGASPVPSADAAKRIWSSAEVTRFYDDVRRGVYRGKEEQMQAREQEINRALAEGRIAA